MMTNKCWENKACELFAIWGVAVTRDMSDMPYKKLKEILSNYSVSNKIKYYLKYILFDLNC